MSNFIYQSLFSPLLPPAAPAFSSIVAPNKLNFKGTKPALSPSIFVPNWGAIYDLHRGIDLLACVDLTKTWTTHFTSQGWASPQDQINAGFPIFIQPALTTGSYTKIFDFNTIITNITANIFYSSLVVSGNVTLGFQLYTSTDGVTWTGPTSGTSIFATSLRYVKVVITFTGIDTKSLVKLLTLTCNLNVHLENDGGNVNCLAADASGTLVTFNKTFLSVNSITVIANSTTLQTPVAIFTYSTINPTSFLIKVFDSTGSRVDANVGWHARGILS